jgi:hypothetical protein
LKSVPDYRGPSDAPDNLGTPATDDEKEDTFKKPKSSRLDPPRVDPTRGAGDSSDDTDDSLASIDDERFVSPTQYQTTSANPNHREPRRLSAKPRPSPYKRDPDGYAWLRGVVARDPKTNAWRITYSRNGIDGDPYGGSLTLVDDPALDTLIDDDVILVVGAIDESVPDRFGKPCYRVQKMERLVPKEN